MVGTPPMMLGATLRQQGSSSPDIRFRHISLRFVRTVGGLCRGFSGLVEDEGTSLAACRGERGSTASQSGIHFSPSLGALDFSADVLHATIQSFARLITIYVDGNHTTYGHGGCYSEGLCRFAHTGGAASSSTNGEVPLAHVLLSLEGFVDGIFQICFCK